MNTEKIIKGLVAIQLGCNPQEVLKRCKEQLAQENAAHKNNVEQTKNDHQKWLAQQQVHTKTSTQPKDHSGRHDASRQYAGSRRR